MISAGKQGLEAINRDYERVAAGLNIGVMVLDSDLRLLRCNPLLKRLFEGAASDIEYPVPRLRRRLDYPEMEDVVRGVLQGGPSSTREVRSDDGRWYQVVIQPGDRDSGSIDDVILVFIDITERRRVEAELRASEDRWRQLVELHPEPILISVEGQVVFSNPAGARVFGGTSVDDIIGRSVFDFIVPELHRVFEERLAQLNQGKATAPYEHQLRRLDGARRDVVAASIPVVYKGQRAAQTVLRDVTDRKRAERELREERNFIHAVIETLDALIVVLDEEGRIVRMNRACEDLTGYTEEEVLGDDVIERFVPAEQQASVRNVTQRLCDSEASSHSENHWITRSGDRRLIAWSKTIIPDERGRAQFIISTGIDITEQRFLEKAVLHITDEERQRIGRDLHDELGSQLTGMAMLIRGVVQDLRAGRTVPPDEVEEVAVLARKSAEKARSIAHSLNPVQLDSQGLLAALHSLADSVEKLAGIPGSFESEVDRVTVERDVGYQLYWIAQEAVNNAMKHADARHIRIRLHRVEVNDQECLRLTIEDDGAGLERRRTGSGMGLNTMQYRARLIGARLDIHSQPDAGTVVQCVFPLTDAAAQERDR